MENGYKKGKIKIHWDNGRIRINMDISWRLIAVLIGLLMYIYAPQLLETLRQALG